MLSNKFPHLEYGARATEATKQILRGIRELIDSIPPRVVEFAFGLASLAIGLVVIYSTIWFVYKLIVRR
jgi:hypothetical protein